MKLELHKQTTIVRAVNDDNDPIFIERTYFENTKEVIWYGITTNYKLKNNIWYILINGDWIETDIPKLEKLYLKIINKI